MPTFGFLLAGLLRSGWAVWGALYLFQWVCIYLALKGSGNVGRLGVLAVDAPPLLLLAGEASMVTAQVVDSRLHIAAGKTLPPEVVLIVLIAVAVVAKLGDEAVRNFNVHAGWKLALGVLTHLGFLMGAMTVCA